MDYEEIKKLIDDMGNAKIDELEIEFPEGIKITRTVLFLFVFWYRSR